MLKQMTLVKIHKRDLSDLDCHMKPHEPMEITSDEEMTIILDSGIELPVEPGAPTTIAFGPGTYKFNVRFGDEKATSPGGPVRVP